MNSVAIDRATRSPFEQRWNVRGSLVGATGSRGINSEGADLASDSEEFLVAWCILNLITQKLVNQYCNRLLSVDCAVYKPLRDVLQNKTGGCAAQANTYNIGNE